MFGLGPRALVVWVRLWGFGFLGFIGFIRFRVQGIGFRV